MGDFMGKRLALLAIRILVSVNLLYAAIFLKFAGVPGSVALFTRISQAVHGWVSQPTFRLGSGAFETVAAILLLIPKTARWAAGLIVVWMTAVILSHILVLGYGWFFIDALMVMLLAVIYVSLTRRRSHWAEHERVEIMAAIQTHQK
jgi:chromate transport protein ChrA